MAARKTARGRASGKGRKGRRWSAEVTRRSDALALESRVFTRSRREIAASLMRGRGLGPARRAKLERAKKELRALHGRASPRTARARTKLGSRDRTRHGRRSA